MATTDEQIASLFRRITELPDEAQAELVHALLEMRAEHLGIYSGSGDECIALDVKNS